MAAPGKKGLDYFSFSVDLLNDPKLRRPKMQYGYLAPMVYISLLSLLYRDKGYYIDYSDKDAIIWYVLGDLQGKYCPNPETVAEVITALVACGLFSDDLFQREIISSKRAQRTFYSATVTRKTVDIDGSIWLLTDADMAELSVKHCYYLKTHNQPINPVNQPINEVNQSINSQRKVKKSKEKYSKKESVPGLPPAALTKEKPIKHKHGEYGWVLLTDEQYARLLADFGEEEVQRCITYIDESAQSNGNKNHWKDWNLVVRKCSRNGWGLGYKPKAQKPAPESNVDRWAQIEQMAEAKRDASGGSTMPKAL